MKIFIPDELSRRTIFRLKMKISLADFGMKSSREKDYGKFCFIVMFHGRLSYSMGKN